MSAKAKAESRGEALRVYAESALARRRAWAAYRLNAGECSAAAARLLAVAALVAALGFWAVRQVGLALASRSTPHERPLLLSRTTQQGGFERFYLTHTVRDGETLWGLAQHYYGAATTGNLRRLRKANPALSEDPMQFKIGLTLKIPVAEAEAVDKSRK